jgi:Asp-tRNA(Asn)/Glu-tRNA(Gln) amidotransferase C subunit
MMFAEPVKHALAYLRSMAASFERIANHFEKIDTDDVHRMAVNTRHIALNTQQEERDDAHTG